MNKDQNMFKASALTNIFVILFRCILHIHVLCVAVLQSFTRGVTPQHLLRILQQSLLNDIQLISFINYD